MAFCYSFKKLGLRNLDLGHQKAEKDMESGAGFHGLREKTGERVLFDVETKTVKIIQPTAAAPFLKATPSEPDPSVPATGQVLG